MLYIIIYAVITVTIIDGVRFRSNQNSDISADDNFKEYNKTLDQSEQEFTSHEIEIEKSNEESKDKRFLADALETVLDPNSVIEKHVEPMENFSIRVEELGKAKMSIESFMEEVDNVSLEVCKRSQQALWAYVMDFNDIAKKTNMIRIATDEEDIKKQYWDLLKSKYLHQNYSGDPIISRKIRIIKGRGINVQTPHTKEREEIDDMQRIWGVAAVIPYNTTVIGEEPTKTMSDIITIFKTSNDSDELAYYWKGYRDATGKQVRPVFKDYVNRMNLFAQSENFTDAGAIWRYMYEDDNFEETVQKLWMEIKPLYNTIHQYVRLKLRAYYMEQFKDNITSIPAHLLGNLWAQDWQAIYHMVAPYPDVHGPHIHKSKHISTVELFEAVDQFYQSIGFDTSIDSYEDISDYVTPKCLPSSHDMCDGVHYKIKWCDEKSTDVTVRLQRASRLLGHVQYFKSYRSLPLIFRDGPTPAFLEGLSDIIGIQMITPEHLKALNMVEADTGHEATMNHLLWLALEKLPLIAYGYVLDKWRWRIFSDINMENWNQYWWELRINETGISPPVPRNESDLDPASKYHVVSHVPYITYLISHVIEFQVMRAMCKAANHTGPLHNCTVYGAKDAGTVLKRGMSLGASVSWQTVLEAMTGERELSTIGLLEYFHVLKNFLEEQNNKLLNIHIDNLDSEEDMDASTPIIVGVIVVILTACIILLYCSKKYNFSGKLLSFCGLSKNGSLDIVTHEMPRGKSNEVEGIAEAKV